MKKFFLIAALSAVAIINARTIDFALDFAGEQMQVAVDGDSQSLKLIGKEVVAQVAIDHLTKDIVQFQVKVMRNDKVISEPVMQVAWGQTGTLELVDQDGNQLTLSAQANK
jgi:hypothetical protein